MIGVVQRKSNDDQESQLERKSKKLNKLKEALLQHFQKLKSNKISEEFQGIVEQTESRLQLNSSFELTQESINDIDFGKKTNLLVSARREALDTSRSQVIPFNLKMKEMKQERSLSMFNQHQNYWEKHQMRHEKYFKSEALKTKFPNPSTFKKTPVNSSFIQNASQSVIFSGDDFGYKMNSRQSQALLNLATHERHMLPPQIWYD